MPETPANVHETSALPDDIRESLAVVNIKTVAEAPAVLQNLATANSVNNQQLMNLNAIGHQQAMNQIREATLGKMLQYIIETSPSEGGTAAVTLGQLAKVLGLTPPVTPPTP